MSAVCVPREHERNRQRHGFRKAGRVVSQEDEISRRTLDHPGDVRRPSRPETDPCQIERLTSDHDPRAGVPEHGEPVPLQCRRHVVIVVVVAKDRKDAVSSAQWRERLSGRRHEVAGASPSPGDVIAAEDDQVRILREQRLHGRVSHLVRHRVASMEIRQEANAQTRERGRQAAHLDRLACHGEVATLIHIAMVGRAGDDPCPRGGETLQHVSPAPGPR